MFLKKLLAMATKSETLVHATKAYSMYDTTFEGRKATKLVLAHPAEPYSFLRKIKNDTIINLYKLNVEKRTLITRRLLPFSSVFRKEAKEFNRYILFKVAQALEFLHAQCGVVHGNVTKDALFFGDDGGIALGGFEKSRKSDVFDEDSIMFSCLISEMVGIDMSLPDFIKNRGLCSDLFFDLEIAFFGYKSFTTDQKLDFISRIQANKDELVGIHKKRISWMVLADVSAGAQKDFKVVAVDFVLGLEVPNMEELLPGLFSMLDTGIRLYLLRNSEKYISSVTTLDPVIKSLSLGIKCKDRHLREETVAFVKQNIGLISRRQQAEILETMYYYVSDDQGISLVLGFICEVRPIFKKTDVVYRILCKYLIQSKGKMQVLGAMEIFYPTFDSFKMTTELLPLLCGYLSDRHVQSEVFLLIEKILVHLKEHKGEIIAKEWKIGSIKNIFRAKTPVDRDDKTQSEALPSRPQANLAQRDGSDPNDQADRWDEPW